jgi:hypothetical protein
MRMTNVLRNVLAIPGPAIPFLQISKLLYEPVCERECGETIARRNNLSVFENCSSGPYATPACKRNSGRCRSVCTKLRNKDQEKKRALYSL